MDRYRGFVKSLSGFYAGLRDTVIADCQQVLEQRDKTASYLLSDKDIFTPFIQSYVLSTLVNPFDSLAKDIGERVKENISDYENENNIKIYKSDLYYALAMLSIKGNDEVNAIIYWNLASEEEAIITGTPINYGILVSKLESDFKSIYNPIRDSYVMNKFISGAHSIKYGFIKSFDDLVVSTVEINRVHAETHSLVY